MPLGDIIHMGDTHWHFSVIIVFLAQDLEGDATPFPSGICISDSLAISQFARLVVLPTQNQTQAREVIHCEALLNVLCVPISPMMIKAKSITDVVILQVCSSGNLIRCDHGILSPNSGQYDEGFNLFVQKLNEKWKTLTESFRRSAS